jgi:hypothetical protein
MIPWWPLGATVAGCQLDRPIGDPVVESIRCFHLSSPAIMFALAEAMDWKMGLERKATDEPVAFLQLRPRSRLTGASWHKQRWLGDR